MIYPMKQFSGKSNDSLEYVAEAIMQKKGIRIASADTLTLCPFFRRYEKQSKKQLLKPVVSLSKGMNILVKCLGLNQSFMEEYTDNDLLIKKISSHVFEEKPIVLGPLNKKAMWNRVDSLFYDNQSYFIMLIGRAEEGFYVYDPEGTPYLRLDTEDLLKNMEKVSITKLLIYLGEIEEKPINMDELWCIFFEELRVLCQCIKEDNCAGAKGLALLHNDIKERVRSSQKMSLYYNFLDIQKANQSIKECFLWNPIAAVCESSKNQICGKFDEYNQVIGNLILDIIHEDIMKIKKNLLICADLEEELLELYTKL